MRYVSRKLENVVQGAGRHFPTVVVTGPRRAGKTTLLRQLFPKTRYVLLEDPDIRGRIRSDPRTFLEELRPPSYSMKFRMHPSFSVTFVRYSYAS